MEKKLELSENILYMIRKIVTDNIMDSVFINTCIEMTDFLIIEQPTNKIVLTSKEEVNTMKKCIINTTLNCILIEMLGTQLLKTINKPNKNGLISSLNECIKYIDNTCKDYISNDINTVDIDKHICEIGDIINVNTS